MPAPAPVRICLQGMFRLATNLNSPLHHITSRVFRFRDGGGRGERAVETVPLLLPRVAGGAGLVFFLSVLSPFRPAIPICPTFLLLL